MAWNNNATYGKRTAKVGTDLTVANGATLTDIASGAALAAAARTIYHISRVWGRVSGDWTLQYRTGGANTTIGFANAGSDNLDVPGLDFQLPANAEIRVVGTDATSELYIEYLVDNIVTA